MKMRPVLQFSAAIGLLLFATLSYGRAQQPANPEELRKLCETILCREPGPVRLMLDNGKPFETRFDSPLPIVQNEWVSIFPGETVFVEAEASGDRLINLRAVAATEHPEKTLIFEFSQAAGSRSMRPVITNPFKKHVKYHAGMLPTGEKLFKTSSCPVIGGGGKAFEAWPNAIFQLVLFDFRLLDEGAKQGTCEY